MVLLLILFFLSNIIFIITPYIIRFSFIKDDTIIDMTNSLDKRNALPGDKIDDEMFQKAIVGQTYRVRYFPNKSLPKARIYIYEPVMVSDEDYMRLMERVYVEQQRVEKKQNLVEELLNSFLKPSINKIKIL